MRGLTLPDKRVRVSILPDKRVRVSDSLLNVGAILLDAMRPSQTVTELWNRVRARPEIGTFARFVLGLDLLFILGVVSYRDGMVVKGP